jgi:2-oxoglutarate ferredoxin oxidoreductase subunit alpha
VVEQNRDGQLRMLLINEGDIDPRKLRRVLHYDGTPITASIITGAIVEVAQELKIVPMRQPVPAAE